MGVTFKMLIQRGYIHIISLTTMGGITGGSKGGALGGLWPLLCALAYPSLSKFLNMLLGTAYILNI